MNFLMEKKGVWFLSIKTDLIACWSKLTHAVRCLGEEQPEEVLDWLDEVVMIFEFLDFPENTKVK